MFFPLKPPFGLGRFDYWRVLPSNTNTPRGGQDDRDQILGIGPLATAAQDQSSGHETPLKEKWSCNKVSDIIEDLKYLSVCLSIYLSNMFQHRGIERHVVWKIHRRSCSDSETHASMHFHICVTLPEGKTQQIQQTQTMIYYIHEHTWTRVIFCSWSTII